MCSSALTVWESLQARRAAFMPAAALLAAMSSSPCLAQVSGDFNGDGFADLAIGVPDEDIGDPNAGAVSVLYGGPAGLTAVNDQLWQQDSLDISGESSVGDRFGAALAVGDFNGDGFDDLAIGIPGDEVNGNVDAGSITILVGSASGLISGGNQQLNLSYEEMPFELAGNQFGTALASGDFDNDGFDDLAIGAPGHGDDPNFEAGGVVVMFGTADGLDSFSSVGITQDTPGIPGVAEPGDHFGAALASGNFNGDDFDDLAIGVPGEGVVGVEDAGGVHVLYGGFIGADPNASQLWSQDSNNIAETSESGDHFGATLAAGDFDADTFDDLAIGVPGEDLGSVQQIKDAGAVHLLFGRDIGLRPAGNRLITQTAGSGSSSESNDRFGSAMAFGDFNGDGADDLLIGAPGESLQDLGDGQDVARGGAAYILRGNAVRLLTFADTPLHQQGLSGLNRPRQNDRFGSALAVGDFNGDGRDDAAVSIPLKNVAEPDSGAVAVFHGEDSARLLSAAPGGLWTQDSPGIANSSGRNDHFGGANRIE